MASVTISDIDLTVPAATSTTRPLVNQIATVRYRPATSTDILSNYITVTSNAILKARSPNTTSTTATFDIVNINGVPTPLTFTIGNYNPDIDYVLWITSNCSVGGVKVTLAATTCPAATNLVVSAAGVATWTLPQNTTRISEQQVGWRVKRTGGAYTYNSLISPANPLSPTAITATLTAAGNANPNEVLQVIQQVICTGLPDPCPKATNLAVTSAGVATWNLPSNTANISEQQLGWRIKGSGNPFTYSSGVSPANPLSATATTATITAGQTNPNMVIEVNQQLTCNTGDTVQ